MPWSALSAANALVGLAILLWRRTRSPPCCRGAAAGPPGTATQGRTAIAICIRNEDMDTVLPPLARLMDGLARGRPDRFALWLLSDTPAGPAAEAEEAAIRAFAAGRTDTNYRRRAANDGFKAGNVMDFLDHHAEGLDHFLCLDADSEMTPEAVLRLVARAGGRPETRHRPAADPRQAGHRRLPAAVPVRHAPGHADMGDRPGLVAGR